MEVIKGETYRHYKGSFYQVIAITNPTKSGSHSSELVVIDEANLEPLKLYCNGEYCWLEDFSGNTISKTMVVYRNTQKLEKPWAREIDSFTGKNNHQEPRFTLVHKDSVTY